ncbi:uncharacterized protein LOC116466985 [Hylobates moloch]|uniref:uncharacterized protein LOC116466985 n=1 Tax=Hylobates moloch TaxID=81572 RepID=UPI0026751FC9|nr:uncharacterized protein LOC116466985 [Hylobates moloch]
MRRDLAVLSQGGLKLLASSNPPALASQSAGITGLPSLLILSLLPCEKGHVCFPFRHDSLESTKIEYERRIKGGCSIQGSILEAETGLSPDAEPAEHLDLPLHLHQNYFSYGLGIFQKCPLTISFRKVKSVIMELHDRLFAVIAPAILCINDLKTD